MLKSYLTIIAIVIFLVPSIIKGQEYEVGISGGVTGYMGDLNSTNPFYFKNLGGGVLGRYNMNPTWFIQLDMNYLFLTGRDYDFNNQFQRTRNLSFNNEVKEISLKAGFNFFKYSAGRRLNKYTPYILGGVSLLMHDPYLNYSRTKIHLQKMKLEIDENQEPVKYSNLAVAIPMVIGFKYNITGSWTLGAEINYRVILNDQIDNVSKYYAYEMPQDIQSPSNSILIGNSNQPFSQADWEYLVDPSNKLQQNKTTARGDGKKFDSIATAGINLTYTFINSKCKW